ncbi:HEPN domain protein [Geobacter metallireducens RCH3]|uniref:Nucleotide-binding HEPN domain protein n=1 Tax=Geobacter metallireducens (strain ATCC 53774 / DSM 7210 / GS-15) TaxID=269799 RepID=Q39Z61_GEOMG|nr:HEPN domain-containing protein [Geobacter metallireducens]ABB30463.1 nucleotide-binding HEPN domain protein [Geobacter metallireducens GS-15]EHP87340.1 HEPN domain protein [Geobacter metallireducens RCH3]
MKPETAELTSKADADLATAQREASVDDAPNFDEVCFHAQQCAEKYLKAIMVETGVRVPRIHDLEALVNLLFGEYPGLERILRFARILSAMAVEVRYPGMTADEDDATESLKAATLIREAVQEILCGSGDAGVK